MVLYWTGSVRPVSGQGRSARRLKGMNSRHLDRRICVVGAGAAGLSAAHFLRKRGYRRVVVLEASDRVGGKCCSHPLGNAQVEAGALAATGSWREVLSLAREVGVEFEEPPDQLVFDERTGSYSSLEDSFKSSLSPSSAAVMMRYFFHTLKHRSLRSPGFAGVAADLGRPFSEWAARHGLSALEPLLELPVTGFGYGTLDAVPAAYVLKYVHAANFVHLLRVALGRKASFRIAGGFEGLCRSIAAPLDVRLRSEVVGIERGAPTTLETRQGRLECDDLVIAIPLDQALSFLDASPEEQFLASQIRYNTYYVTLCMVRGLPDASISMHPLPGPGETCFLARGWEQTEATVAYAYGPSDPISQDQRLDHLDRAIHKLGGSLEAIERQLAWQYFPHVGPEAFADGFFASIEARQGARNTYFAGSMLSFETVEEAVAYSRKLVERFF